MLWQSYGISKRNHRLRFIGVVIITAILVELVSFFFLSGISLQIYFNYRKDPPNSACLNLSSDEMRLSYDDRLKLAGYEFLYLEQLKSDKERFAQNLDDKISEYGTLPCFCRQ